MKLDDLFLDYLEYLEIEKNRSQKTVENYDHYLRHFLDFIQKKFKITQPEEITFDSVRKYRIHLNRLEVKEKKLKIATQNYYIIALRGFLKYLAKRDIKTLTAEKVEVGSNPSRDIEFLESQEVERLLNSAKSEDLASLRDRAILELLFSTGLRVSELISLNRDSLNLERQEFSVRGKGDKIRIVFISDEAKNYLEKYLSKRKDIDPAVFIRLGKNLKNVWTENGLRLTARSVQRIVKKYSLKAGIVKDVHPHTLRHSFATDLLQNGADIRSVQELLGHSNITTTQIYTHITNQALKEVHQKFHGRRKLVKES